ncbi:hypothetical protein [Fuerstiella marisgermanici]|uniref:Uncharacterized protein n=1 Tax=Fuerstiella marisgermanici TaxID=1891926 RepID=A0A1P8WDB6_9PLAN|nr:hypothetical protein [Fuerstiella marisgermanici]APZ92050.1 hypothetical protein Fuma_01654 [Fuerstiella marisgermanici]
MSTSVPSIPTKKRSLTLWSVGLTFIFEAVTCLLRFGMQMESTRNTASTIGHITCGLRIHHSYIGVLMIVFACWLWQKFPGFSWGLLAAGLGLFFSDMIHHFLVLWPIVGSPQFDLVYPTSS